MFNWGDVGYTCTSMYQIQERPKNKKVVFTVACLEKNGSVGRDLFFTFFFVQPNHLKCTYWLSLCFTSINFVFIKEKES